jgi:plastocyanin
MLRRGTRGRRLWALSMAVAAAAISAMAYAGISLAASDAISAGPAEAYDHQPADNPYNTDQGVVVQFLDNGGTHNVTARLTGPDGQPLFRSPTISGGSAGVAGTQFLTPGDYQFFCAVHPTTMHGTLHVTGNGTALARPHADLTLQTKTISKALKKGLLVGIDMSAKIDGVSLTAKLGKATIARATGLSMAAGQQFAVIKLTKSGKTKLRSRDKATVTVTADVPFGAPSTIKAKLR